ncbi:LysM peptidoglycan-binding domain-containing protein [Nonomuraea indica]|uniref:LysM peptidoglycan-binding domain-containing protein n=1 Tax=Nonomuraea indica TaxID=1581193 RepID=A0ABW8AF83_9ACTN|nr:LysM peptidoglycan-binding domain-containing protein [Nonomuraea indica]
MTEPPERPESVTLTPEDTLWSLAEEYFEDASRWKAIYEANRDVLADPAAVRPGMVLRLPMEIYPRHLRAVAGVFEDEAVDLADVARQAADDLNAIGDFWGQGTLGTTFFKGEGGERGYEAVSGQFTQGLKSLEEGHQGIGRRLRLTADRVEVADWESVAAILAALPDPEQP